MTKRFSGSVTVTLIRTSWVSTRILGSRRAAGSSASFDGLDARLDIDSGFRSGDGLLVYLLFGCKRQECREEEKAGKRVQQTGFHDHISEWSLRRSEYNKGVFHAMIERAYPNSGRNSCPVRLLSFPR